MENETALRVSDAAAGGPVLIFGEAEPCRIKTGALHLVRRVFDMAATHFAGDRFSRRQTGGTKTGGTAGGGKWTCQATIL